MLKMAFMTARSKPILTSLILSLFLAGSVAGDEPPERSRRAPIWSQSVIWYQIFVERFRNGDPTNDPRLRDGEGAWPHLKPVGWRPTRWQQDWYELEDWARPDQDFYKTVYMRRYGGDLQGVSDQLEYLRDLGVTAIYLNPVNDAPSLHKYDARHYRHIDRNFGPDPEGDERLMQLEDPADPKTWQWSSADLLFLEVIDKAHKLGMRLIVDYSWNHTGTTFWAWQNLVQEQQASAYRDWYEVSVFDDPQTSENEFAYRGWHGVPDLPQFKRHQRDDGQMDLHPDVKQHVYAVTRRWLDPNADGDPSDGVDGFRLDVAAELPLAFWNDYRGFVKNINSEAILLGEIWWDKWPVRLADPAPWLQGDVFDSVMDYRGYVASRGLFANAIPRETPSSYVKLLAEQRQAIPPATQRALMCLVSGHDSPRSLTSIYNPGLYKYRTDPRSDRQYRVDRPDSVARQKLRMILLRQFTGIGSPHIYYGDEVGMWGADDPDNRKPMLWADLDYDNEQMDPFGRPRSNDSVQPDLQLLDEYRRLIKLRRGNLDLFVEGDEQIVEANDDKEWLVLARNGQRRRAVIIYNLGNRKRIYRLHGSRQARDPLTDAQFKAAPHVNWLEIPVVGGSGRVLISEFD